MSVGISQPRTAQHLYSLWRGRAPRNNVWEYPGVTAKSPPPSTLCFCDPLLEILLMLPERPISSQNPPLRLPSSYLWIGPPPACVAWSPRPCDSGKAASRVPTVANSAERSTSRCATSGPLRPPAECAHLRRSCWRPSRRGGKTCGQTTKLAIPVSSCRVINNTLWRYRAADGRGRGPPPQANALLGRPWLGCR